MSWFYTTPMGERVRINYLTEEELDRLLLIDTTEDQAERILDRNRSAIQCVRRQIDGRVSDRVRIWKGCPHCQDNDECCDECPWGEAFCILAGPYRDRDSCCLYSPFSFGGVLIKQTSIRYTCDCVVCHRRGPVELAASIKYLGGHLDWARVVIAMCGTSVPE